jgi:hypothetical protein
MPGVPEAGVAGQCQHGGRGEEAEEGRPGRLGSVLRHLESRTVLLVDKLDRQEERHGQGRARGEFCDLAQRGRVRLLGEVHADPGRGDHGWLAGVEARGCQLLPPRARLEADWNQPQPIWDTKTEFDQALVLPGGGAGAVDFEDLQPGGDFRSTLDEGVETGS